MNRMANQEDTRTRILNLAIAAIDAGGEAAIRVNHLVAAAGVRPPVLYHYFGSRDGLIVAAYAERYRQALTTSAHPILDAMMMCVEEDDYVQLIVANISLMLNEGRDRRRIRVQALGAATSRPELHEAVREAHRSAVLETTKIFAFGQVRGWMNRAYTAETLCELWFAVITGLYVPEAYADAGTAPLVGPALLDMICLLLFGRAVPAPHRSAPGEPSSADPTSVTAPTASPTAPCTTTGSSSPRTSSQ